MRTTSANLILPKLASVCAEVFRVPQPDYMRDALMIIRELSEEALELVTSLLREDFAIEGPKESSFNTESLFPITVPDGWEKCDWEDLLAGESLTSESSRILEASRWVRIFDEDPSIARNPGPLVCLDNENEPAFAIDFSIGVAARREFVALDIFSAEERWTGLHDLGVFAKGRIASVALTEAVVANKTIGPKPWFYKHPDRQAFDYFVRKAKAASNPYRVCEQCEEVRSKLSFSESRICDSCRGIIH